MNSCVCSFLRVELVQNSSAAIKGDFIEGLRYCYWTQCIYYLCWFLWGKSQAKRKSLQISIFLKFTVLISPWITNTFTFIRNFDLYIYLVRVGNITFFSRWRDVPYWYNRAIQLISSRRAWDSQLLAHVATAPRG